MSLNNDFYFSDDPKEFKVELKNYLEDITLAINGVRGEWSPTIIGSTTDGETTYEVQNGYYVKVFDMVDLFYDVEWSNTTATGSIYIETPFVAQNFSSNIYSGICECNKTLVFPTGRTYITTKPLPGTRNLQITAFGDSVNAKVVTVDEASRLKGFVRFPVQSDQIGV